MKFRNWESNWRPILGDIVTYFGKTASKTTDFQTFLEVNNPEEDGKKQKEKPFSYQSWIPENEASSKAMLTVALPWCSLMVMFLGVPAILLWKGEMQPFSWPHFWHQTYLLCALLSSSREPVKSVQQCGDPEKPVLPLRDWDSWCLGLWVHGVLISKVSFLLGYFDIFVEGKGVLPRTVFSRKETSSATKDSRQDPQSSKVTKEL